MGKKRLLYAEDGIATYHYYDHGEKKTIIQEVNYNTQALLDHLHRTRVDGPSGAKSDMKHLASVDPILWSEWWREFGGNPMSPENKPRLMKKLRDRDYSKLRATEDKF